MDARLSLVTLGVSNIGRSRAFYERLGWQPSNAGNEHVVFFQLNGCALALFGRAALADDAQVKNDGTGFDGVTLAYNVRKKEQVGAVLKEAARAGARIVKPAQDVFWGGHSGYFADPDGHLWEVAWNPFFPLDRKGNLSLEKKKGRKKALKLSK
ncbi:MAG TPA: VOC family protein [Planctomycetota bacterium]|nr:VOC family protein [Planctomycetota bacterium]